MSNGSIYIWNGLNLIRALTGHTSPVYSLKNRSDQKKGNVSLVSGDKNGTVFLWNSKL